MYENIRQAIQGIFAHKLRTFLTMLGIIIGIASIISIVSTIKGTNEQIKKNLIGSGNNTVEVELTENGYAYDMDYSEVPKGVPMLGDYQREELLKLDNIEDVAFYNVREVMDGIYYQNQALTSGKIYGVSSHYFDTCEYRLKSGRFFLEDDYLKFRKVMILDTDAAEILFHGKNPVGQTIEVKGEPFTVIGLVEQKGKTEVVINTPDDYFNYMSESAGGLFIPDAAWSIVYRFDEPQNVVARAATTDDMNNLGNDIARYLNSSLTVENVSISYKPSDVLGRAQEMQELSSSTNKQLLWIASISLLVGGIGVMNIMLVSVTERTSEIGLKKAIGARNETILYQFLTEAVVMTSLGGVIGVIVGIVMSKIISGMSGAPSAISVGSVVISVVFSMFIGIVFGLLPSVKASKLNPIDALRHE